MADDVKQEEQTGTEAHAETPETEAEEIEVPAAFKEIVGKIESLKVTELAELVTVLQKKFGVAAIAAPAAGGAGAAGGEEKTEFDVLLKSAGDQKINVIKAVKEITGLGLKEAKDIVDSAPKVVKEGLKKEDADALKAKLEGAGATVELQ